MNISSKFVKTIFVSVPAFMDEELPSTISDMLAKAKIPTRLIVSVLSQDQDDGHPELSQIFDRYGAKYIYNKINYKESFGVGFARAKIQSDLKPDYDYYFQIDSHSRFVDDWDIKIINDYNRMLTLYQKDFIISSYPFAYEYDDSGNEIFIDDIYPTAVKIVESKNPMLRFEAKYCQYLGGIYGIETGYFCAGMAFGPTELFMKVPYDTSIYFNGEEQSMSVRFFDKGIDIIAPPRNYIYHDYVGKKRKRNWEKNEELFASNDGFSIKRVNDLFDGAIDDIFKLDHGMLSYIDFYAKFVLGPEND